MNSQEITDRIESSPSNALSPEDSSSKKRRPFSLRGFASLLLALSFLAMCFSGAVLFVTPRGRFANWNDWTLLGLGKGAWQSIHITNSLVLIGLALVHLVLNWSVFLRYLRSKTVAGLNMKKELSLALVIAAVCVAGPIYEIQPFGSLMVLNEDIKNYWEQHPAGRAEQPPVPHAEELTLTELAERIGLTVEQVSSALADQGYQAADAGLTVRHLAEQRDVAPSVVFAAIRERFPESRGWGRVTRPGHRDGCDDARSAQSHGAEATDRDRPKEAAETHRGDGEGHGPGGGWGGGRGMGVGRGAGGMGRGMRGSLP
jgi:hypothetical protein